MLNIFHLITNAAAISNYILRNKTEVEFCILSNTTIQNSSAMPSKNEKNESKILKLKSLDTRNGTHLKITHKSENSSKSISAVANEQLNYNLI
jgi:hypothetical protein